LTVAAVELAGLDVEDVNEDSDLGEHIRFLRRQVILRKGVLTLKTKRSVKRFPPLEHAFPRVGKGEGNGMENFG
jgi:hypothetical protein